MEWVSGDCLKPRSKVRTGDVDLRWHALGDPWRHEVAGKNEEKSGNKMGRGSLEVTGGRRKGAGQGSSHKWRGERGKCYVTVIMGSRSKEGLSLYKKLQKGRWGPSALHKVWQEGSPGRKQYLGTHRRDRAGFGFWRSRSNMCRSLPRDLVVKVKRNIVTVT